jgi:hypothetical protein
MGLENMTREELVERIKELTDYMDNVVVFWGGKRELRATLEEVARNESGEYSQEEARNAAIIVGTRGAFEAFIELVRDSFDRRGINYIISEKLSALMEEAAARAKGGA